MSSTYLIDDRSNSVPGASVSEIKWKKNFEVGIDNSCSIKSASGNKTVPVQEEHGSTSNVMVRKFNDSQHKQPQPHQPHQQLQSHAFDHSANAIRSDSTESSAQIVIADPTSLQPVTIHNNVVSMPVPNSNQDSSHPKAQHQNGHNPSTGAQPSIPGASNNSAWLQHMILNPIYPLQSNPNIVGHSAGNNNNGSANNQATTFARQLQQLQGNNQGNFDNNVFRQQQMSTQREDATRSASSIATSLPQQQQQHQAPKQLLLASQQVWPSEGQQQSQSLQQGLQLNQMLSLQQQQLLPLNEFVSQLQPPSASQTQQQHEVATSSINQIAALPKVTSTLSSAQQQQQLLLLALMLQQNNTNNNTVSVDTSLLSTMLASPEGIRLLNSLLQPPPRPLELQVHQQKQVSQFSHSGSAAFGPGHPPSNLRVDHLSPVPVLGIQEDALSNQNGFLISQQSQQPQPQSQSEQLPPIPMSIGATAINQHFPSPTDGHSSAVANTASGSNQIAVSNITRPSDIIPSILTSPKPSNGNVLGSIDSSSLGFPLSLSSIKSDKGSKGGNTDKTPTANPSFPRVLYCESDDSIVGEYQTLLRQQLELFEADSHDVINGTFRQGRTTPIRLGQIGLRCKHCAQAPLSVRTKGSVYFSQTIKGMYQIGQNMSKVHLCERCTRLPPDIKKRMITLRSRRHRASGGRAYWIRHLREMGIYEDGTVLRAHPSRERKKPPVGKKPASSSAAKK